MKKLLAAVLSAALVSATGAAAKADPVLVGDPHLQAAQWGGAYFWGGHRYCWYYNGWRGPGWYWCGYPWRSGWGWGGGWGWNSWIGPGPTWWSWGQSRGFRDFRGGGFRGGFARRDFRGGFSRPGVRGGFAGGGGGFHGGMRSGFVGGGGHGGHMGGGGGHGGGHGGGGGHHH